MEILSNRSPESRISFPDKTELKAWADLLAAQGFPYLPTMDELWAEDMVPPFDLARMRPECREDLHLAAARIFYMVNKGHRRIDGNKRSSIICAYYFYLINKKRLLCTQEDIEGIALKVASSEGNTEDVFIPEIRDFFEKHATEL